VHVDLGLYQPGWLGADVCLVEMCWAKACTQYNRSNTPAASRCQLMLQLLFLHACRLSAAGAAPPAQQYGCCDVFLTEPEKVEMLRCGRARWADLQKTNCSALHAGI
jgi:hypothetical protein